MHQLYLQSICTRYRFCFLCVEIFREEDCVVVITFNFYFKFTALESCFFNEFSRKFNFSSCSRCHPIRNKVAEESVLFKKSNRNCLYSVIGIVMCCNKPSSFICYLFDGSDFFLPFRGRSDPFLSFWLRRERRIRTEGLLQALQSNF